MNILVTGGAGFIGSAVIRHLIARTEHDVVNVDCLTYAGHLSTLEEIDASPRYHFECTDICDRFGLRRVFDAYRPGAVMHLAAESHVDRSIDGPAAFVQTNVVGTCTLLEAARRYFDALRGGERESFRFLHVSTDEVFGSLGDTGLFTEQSPYDPSSPYSASKASADHFVRAWHRTFGLPTMVTNCSNNYGPYQYPEKLIPLMIQNALAGKPLPVYGSGQNVRDWLYVDDHARALVRVLERGAVGETYNIGGAQERKNIEVVETLCELLDELAPERHAPHRQLIAWAPDRPGHDHRYAIDAGKIARDLGWTPQETFATGLERTVRWYLANQAWCERVVADRYAGQRLGLTAKVAELESTLECAA